MSGHAKGRLRFEGEFVVTDSGETLKTQGTQIPMVSGPARLEAIHNMKRLVALWNAAEELGLTTEAIEAGAIQAAFNEPLVIVDSGAIRHLTGAKP